MQAVFKSTNKHASCPRRPRAMQQLAITATVRRQSVKEVCAPMFAEASVACDVRAMRKYRMCAVNFRFARCKSTCASTCARMSIYVRIDLSTQACLDTYVLNCNCGFLSMCLRKQRNVRQPDAHFQAGKFCLQRRMLAPDCCMSCAHVWLCVNRHV